jgi:hypothetical protein
MKKTTNIFSGNEGYKEYDTLASKIKRKRVHYKNTTYTKFYKNDVQDDGTHINDTFLWGRLNTLHIYLSSFFPVFFNNSLFANQGTLYYEDEDTVAYDYGMIRSWLDKYTDDNYSYYGVKYKGQNFNVAGAEIIGTEDLLLDSRLFLHSELLYYLEEGYRIEQLNSWLEELVNYFKQGWTAQSLVLAMIMEGAKNLQIQAEGGNL